MNGPEKRPRRGGSGGEVALELPASTEATGAAGGGGGALEARGDAFATPPRRSGGVLAAVAGLLTVGGRGARTPVPAGEPPGAIGAVEGNVPEVKGRPPSRNCDEAGGVATAAARGATGEVAPAPAPRLPSRAA